MARRHAGLILDSDGRRISTTRLSRAPRCYRIGSIRFQEAAPSNCLSVRLRLNSTRRSYSEQAFASKILCLPLTSRCVVYEIATALLGSARPLPRRSNRLRAPRANSPLVFHPGLKFPLRLFFASTVPAAHSSRENEGQARILHPGFGTIAQDRRRRHPYRVRNNIRPRLDLGRSPDLGL